MRKVLLGRVFGLLILPGIGAAAFAADRDIPISVSVLPRACFVERVAGEGASRILFIAR